MGRKYSKISVVLALVALWLCVTLACNFPGFASAEQAESELSVEQLRQTLAAYVTQTAVLETPLSGPVGAQETPLPAGAPTAEPAECGQRTEDGAYILYCVQVGETLQALAARFDTPQASIISWQPIPGDGFIPAGQVLYIPAGLDETTPGRRLLPDQAVINSPAAAGFDVQGFVSQAGGFLNSYTDTVSSERITGAEVIELVATESSLNPMFLLALLEYQSGWVYGQPANPRDTDVPLGFNISGYRGLYREMIMAATHFYYGYYGWRDGSFISIKYTDGQTARLNPMLNAGSAGVQNIFAKFYKKGDWDAVLYGENSFTQLYQQMFGDPWAIAGEPIFPAGLAQPVLELPFQPNERWSLTGGPHEAWKTGSPRGAIDLAPTTGEPECAVSKAWVTASAPGVIARSDRNAIALDLDGDGYENTGWVILYFHVADKDRIPAGARVDVDTRLGHPSCEGGRTTGTHLHVARKYNGEWLAADGPLPFVLSGWRVYADERNYYGEMRKGDGQLAVASPVGPRTSIVVR